MSPPIRSGAAARARTGRSDRLRRGFTAVVARASTPVDPSSLALVRIAFGLIGVAVAVRTIAYGWVEDLYAGPRHHFHYAGFAWVDAPPVWATYVLVALIGVAGACIALGWRYRLALAVFLVAFGWIELIEVTTYLNHYWFVTLFGIVLLAVPGAACWSLDARRGRGRGSIPFGAVVLVRAQVGVVYLFAGLAKLQTDWLVRGIPLRIWLPTRADIALIGPWLDETWVALAASWAGALFDLLVVPLLCFRRTRPFAWAAVVAFHVITWRLFPIGVFPWLMIAASTSFFSPEWPRRLAGAVRRGVIDAPPPAPLGRERTRLAPWVVVAGCAWITLQVALPLRHLVIPGDYRWTNEGYRFSWVVLLTEKGGDVTFRVTDRHTDRTWTETATDLYTPTQWRMMATEPELIRQAAHTIAAEHARRGRSVEVRADAFVALNGRVATRLVDRRVDLAREPYRIHQPWVLPAPGGRPLIVG